MSARGVVAGAVALTVALILGACDDDPEEPRDAATVAADESERPEIDDPDPQRRYQAAMVLAADDEVATPELVTTLTAALTAELGSPVDVPAPAGSWFSGSERLAWNYVSAMGVRGDEAIEPLRERQTAAEGPLREWLALARGYAGDGDIVPQLERLLDAESQAVRVQAVSLLGELGAEESADLLEPLLRDPFSTRAADADIGAEIDRFPVRDEAAAALRQLGFVVHPDPEDPTAYVVGE